MIDNQADGLGGAIRGVDGSVLTITDSLISGNSAQQGGGLHLIGTTAKLTNCTISGNDAGLQGGGLDAAFGGRGQTTLTNCTVSGNSAKGGRSGDGGGLYLSTGMDFLYNTIVAGNTVAAGTLASDIGGVSLVRGSNNLIGNGNSGGLRDGVNGNIVGVANPLIAPLGDYGGFTKTMPLLPGSPAIDAGTATRAPSLDQRGLRRVGAVDIGAFESQGFTFTLEKGSTPQLTGIGKAFRNPLAVSVRANNKVEPVDGGIVSFSLPGSAASAVLSSASTVINGGSASSRRRRTESPVLMRSRSRPKASLRPARFLSQI